MPKLDMIGNIISKVADNVDRFTYKEIKKSLNRNSTLSNEDIEIILTLFIVKRFDRIGEVDTEV